MIKPEKVPFVLKEEDKRNPLWVKLMGHFSERLDDLRLANDGDRDAVETAKLRGKISEIKSILALDEERKNFSN